MIRKFLIARPSTPCTELRPIFRLVTPSYFSPELQHLLSRMLNKNPHGRITILEMWEDAWVTENGKVPLPDYEENCAEPIGLPTEAEVDSALRSLRSSFLVGVLSPFRLLTIKQLTIMFF